MCWSRLYTANRLHFGITLGRELTKEDQIYTLKGVLVCSNDYKMVMAKQQQDELKKEQQQQHQSPKKQTFGRSHSASLLSSSKTSSRKVVISPPIQMLEGSRVAWWQVESVCVAVINVSGSICWYLNLIYTYMFLFFNSNHVTRLFVIIEQ